MQGVDVVDDTVNSFLHPDAAWASCPSFQWNMSKVKNLIDQFHWPRQLDGCNVKADLPPKERRIKLPNNWQTSVVRDHAETEKAVC